jgi:hypothetical protein
MDTIVGEIAKSRMEKDVNRALGSYGLFVLDIRFDSSNDFSVIIMLGAQDGAGKRAAKNIAVPEGTAC